MPGLVLPYQLHHFVLSYSNIWEHGWCSCLNEEQVEANKGELAVLSCDWCAWFKSCTASIVEEMAWSIRSPICERLIIKLKVQVDFLMPTRLSVASHDLKCLKLHLPSSEPPHV